MAEIESVKSVADSYSPLSGTVASINEALLEKPELLNASPEGEAWLYTLTLSDPDEWEALLDAQAYRAHIGQEP